MADRVESILSQPAVGATSSSVPEASDRFEQVSSFAGAFFGDERMLCEQARSRMNEKHEPVDEVGVNLYKVSKQAYSWRHKDRKMSEVHLSTIQDKLNLIHNKHNKIGSERRKLMTLEAVGKMLPYIRIKYGSELHIPTMIGSEEQLITYRARVCDLGCGNLMYILIPDNTKAPPILSFRGTVTDDWGTLWSSMGPRSLLGLLNGYFVDVGANVVEENKNKIVRVLEELQKKGYAKPIMTGHSLGGALAQRFMVEEGVYDKVSYVCAFNSPTVNYGVTRRWNELENEGKVTSDQALVFNVAGDALADHYYLDFLNRYFIGVKKVFTPGEEMSSLDKHSRCVTSLSGKLKTLERSKAGSTGSYIGWTIMRIPMLVIWLVANVVSLLAFGVLEFFGLFGVGADYRQDREDREYADVTITLHQMAIESIDDSELKRCELQHQLWWDRNITLQNEMHTELVDHLGAGTVEFLMSAL